MPLMKKDILIIRFTATDPRDIKQTDLKFQVTNSRLKINSNLNLH